ncbi:MAG: PD-(D/E)XK nuclease family protein [bacterium]
MISLKVLNLSDDPIDYLASQVPEDPASQFIVFPTARNIRSFHGALARMNRDNAVIAPSCFEMGAFIEQCLDPGGKILIPRHLRPFYLQEAIAQIEQARLDELFKGNSAGLQNDFFEFAATGARILRFFDEIYAEKIPPELLKKASLYTDYEKHIDVLEAIAQEYRSVLGRHGFTDPLFLKLSGGMRTAWLDRFREIHVLVGGYLTRFEIDLLRAIGEEKEIEVVLRYEGEADPQMRKIFHAFAAEPQTMKKAGLPSAIEVRAFREAAAQFGFILHGIERALQSGIPPEEIAVILPDETMKGVLFSLDRKRIFNYAMGLDFRDTALYSMIAGIGNLFSGRIDHLQYRSVNVINLLQHPFIRNLKGDKRWVDDLMAEIKTRNRLILREQDFCRTEIMKDIFSRMKSLMSTERGYGEFSLAVAGFMEALFSSIDEEFLSSISRSPELNEARSAMMNALFQTASLPYHQISRENDPLRHLDYLLDQLSRLTYSDVAGGLITVMGMLETRNLSFRAVIIPDMNEEIIPPKNEKDLFLNTAIRERLGIPTYHDREHLARNYFLSLVKNAAMVFLSYVERDERPIRSRFIEETLIERGHTGEDPSWLRQDKEFEGLVFPSGTEPGETAMPDSIRKDRAVLKSIRDMTMNASVLKLYRQCSYKFYLARIKGLEEPKELAEELEPLDMGNLLHRALRSVYEGGSVFSDPGKLADRIREAVKKEAARYDIFRLSPQAVFELDVLLDKLYRFAESEVSRFREGWRTTYLEYPVEQVISDLAFSGRIDRIDVHAEQCCAFIIDYKFSNVDRLRHVRYDERFVEFQLPLYRLMLSGKHPELRIGGIGYYDLRDSFRLVEAIEHGTAEDFRTLLGKVLDELLSPEEEFVKTDDLRLCLHCGFARICGRQR